ncbi:MAG: DUF421 domain-containing protein [Armatimonadota bacterium]
MDPSQLLWTAVRTLGVYALMLALLRLTGKREIGNFSPFDLLVALMLGEIVDEAIYGDVSFLQFGLAAVLIAALHVATGWMAYASKTLDRILQGSPSMLIKDGELCRDEMRKERISEDEVMAMLREQMVDDLREVKLGTLEASGRLAVVKHEWAEPLQKGDLRGKEAQQKQADTGGQDEPPLEKQTYSPRALNREAA